ncbi:hypothetical protein NSK_003409 [Nannochloropsis salina CCMP1776]|uniref:Uncharacterized protein n=1 Tax=Nannochloropsis salina CCMP1776 TaxID=1027361 RepID=A0A4D9D1X9_9STRA|nr:hypothetical protein NSK_003409 [Nannochloropsis salina CCMP1776]|eukprot:TFJ84984.1 hypothetical protein NSK_003409 [Nannochloropsis salina CCMP1776]
MPLNSMVRACISSGKLLFLGPPLRFGKMEAAKTTERLRHVKQGVDVDRGGDKEAMREVGQGAQSASRENTEELEDAESGSAEEVASRGVRPARWDEGRIEARVDEGLERWSMNIGVPSQ